MTAIRVLVVDDSVVVRRLVTDALNADPRIEVVGTAANGRIALGKLGQLSPDVVTLDVEMPEMDGLATLTAIRERDPRLPVIMFSTVTERGAAITVDALLRGANDYVTKPANVGSVDRTRAAIRSVLVPKVHALASRSRRRAPGSTTSTSTTATVPPATSPPPTVSSPAVTPPPRTMPAPLPPAPRRTPGPPPRVELIVVGVSTGGPNALAELVPALPPTLRVPVLIVQHMPATFTRLLAERLDAAAAVEVREATDGAPLRAGQVLIAPGGRHLAVAGTGARPLVELWDTPAENSCRPAADVLFRTAAQTVGRGVLGLVMTGMGTDGRRGAAEIAAAGGRVVVQDEASSVVWGMPGGVVQAGLAEEAIALPSLAKALVRRVDGPVRRRASAPAREVLT